MCVYALIVYVSGREPMAREPDMALFKNAFGSLAHTLIVVDIYITKQRIHPEQLSKVTVGVVFTCHVTRQSIGQVSAKSDDYMAPSFTTVQSGGSHGNEYLNMRLSWLSQPKRSPTPGLCHGPGVVRNNSPWGIVSFL